MLAMEPAAVFVEGTNRERRCDPEVVVFVKIAHAAVVRILCSVPEVGGVILDAEHGAFSEHDLETLCALVNLAGKLSIVRAPTCESSMVARILDRGANGVMIPRARSPKEVSEAISGVRYAPAGSRGFDPTVSAYA